MKKRTTNLLVMTSIGTILFGLYLQHGYEAEKEKRVLIDSSIKSAIVKYSNGEMLKEDFENQALSYDTTCGLIKDHLKSHPEDGTVLFRNSNVARKCHS